MAKHQVIWGESSGSMLRTIINMDNLTLPDFSTESCVSQEKFLV